MDQSLRLIILLITVVRVSFCAPTSLPSTPDPLPMTLQLFRTLNLEMNELRHCQQQTYDEYKLNRFDQDVFISHYGLDGMPDLSNVSNEDRFFMNESDLLELHRSNIQAFHQFMFFVKMDENISNAIPDFGPEFAIIEARLSRVLAGIEAVMGHLGFFQGGFPTYSPAIMDPENNAAMRSVRDLYVLQEMYSYLAVAVYDFYRLVAVHQAAGQ